MRRARGKRPEEHDLIGIAQEIKDRDLASKPDELRAVLEAAARTRRGQRLREVRALPQNQPTGMVLLVAGAVAAVSGVLAAFCVLSAVVFGAFAKVMFLVLGLAGALIVAVEDPFHEDLGDEATAIERLKLQGKVLVVTTLVAVLCTGLSFYTDHMQAYHDQAELADRIKNASETTVSRLDDVRTASEQIAEQLAVLNGQLKALGDTVDHSLATPLKQIVEVTARIPTRTELLSKDELERKLGVLATADHLNQLTTSVGGLATAESVGRLSTSMSRLATAESVNRLATAESVNQVTAAVGTLATAASVNRLTDSVSRLATADAVSRLATAESVSRLATADAVGRVATRVDTMATTMATLATAESLSAVSRAVTELGQRMPRPPVTELPEHGQTVNSRGVDPTAGPAQR